MRKILPSIFLALFAHYAIAQTLQTNTLTGNIASFNMQGRTNVTMTMQITYPLNRTINGVFISNDPITANSDANGDFVFTNVQWGKYVLRPKDSTGAVWLPEVGTNVSGTVSLASLCKPSSAIPPNPSTNYYTMSQINALVAAIEAGAALPTTNAANLTEGILPDARLSNNIVRQSALDATNATLTALIIDGANASYVYAYDLATNGSTPFNLAAATNLPISGLAGGDTIVTNNRGTVNFDNIAPIGGTAAISVVQRTLGDSNTTTRIDWQNGQLYSGTGGGWSASLDWINRIFYGAWNASGLTNINASNLASGTVADARLSSTLQQWALTPTNSKAGTNDFDTAGNPTPKGTNDITNIANGAIAAAGVVTNRSAGSSLSDLSVSNSANGGLAINRSPIGNESYIKTYQGGLELAGNGSGGQINLANYSGSTIADFYGNISYGWLNGGKPSQPIPFSLQWMSLPSPYDWMSGNLATIFSPKYGGSGGGLTDLPVDPKAMAQGMPKVPFIISSWNGTQFYFGQTECSNVLNNATTNGLLGVIKAAGGMPYFHKDANVFWITNSRINGNLAINTTAFPAGTNFLTQWKTNGWNFLLTVYGWATPSNSEVLLNMTGIQGGPGIGYVPAMTPATVRSDTRTLYNWGDDMRFSDVTRNTWYQYDFSRSIVQAILTPTVNGATWNTTWSDTLNQSIPKPMGYLHLVPNIGFNTPELFNQANIVSTDGAYTFPGQITNATGLVAIMNNFRAAITNWLPYQSHGHWSGVPADTQFADATSTNDAHGKMASAVIRNGVFNIAAFTNSTLDATYLIFMPFWKSTNLMTALFDDSHQAVNLYDNGATNNSAWVKQQKNGSFVVALVNEKDTASSSNLTVNLADYPFSPNYSYAITNLFTGVAVGVSNAVLTVNVTNNDAALFSLTPIAIPEGLTVTRGAFPELTYPYQLTSSGGNAATVAANRDNSNIKTIWYGNSGHTYLYIQGAGAGTVIDIDQFAGAMSFPVNSSFNFKGVVTATNGISSLSSNLLAPSSITFPASGVNWTNTTGRNIGVFIDTAGVTGTTTSINGSQIYSSLVGDMFLPLQNGEYFSMAYTIGTPTAKIKPQ